MCTQLQQYSKVTQHLQCKSKEYFLNLKVRNIPTTDFFRNMFSCQITLKYFKNKKPKFTVYVAEISSLGN